MNQPEKDDRVRVRDQLCKGPEAELRTEQARAILFSPLPKATTLFHQSLGKIGRMKLGEFFQSSLLGFCFCFFNVVTQGVVLCLSVLFETRTHNGTQVDLELLILLHSLC